MCFSSESFHQTVGTTYSWDSRVWAITSPAVLRPQFSLSQSCCLDSQKMIKSSCQVMPMMPNYGNFPNTNSLTATPGLWPAVHMFKCSEFKNMWSKSFLYVPLLSSVLPLSFLRCWLSDLKVGEQMFNRHKTHLDTFLFIYTFGFTIIAVVFPSDC